MIRIILVKLNKSYKGIDIKYIEIDTHSNIRVLMDNLEGMNFEINKFQDNKMCKLLKLFGIHSNLNCKASILFRFEMSWMDMLNSNCYRECNNWLCMMCIDMVAQCYKLSKEIHIFSKLCLMQHKKDCS